MYLFIYCLSVCIYLLFAIYCLHFTDEYTEDRRGQLAGPIWQKQQVTELGSDCCSSPGQKPPEGVPAFRMKPALLPWALKGPHDPEILVASSPKFPPLHTPFSHTLPGFQIFPWKGKSIPVRRSPSFLLAPFLLPVRNFYSSSRYQLRCHSLKPSLIPSSLSLSQLQVWLACIAALMAPRAGAGFGLQSFCVPHCPPPTGVRCPVR